MAWRLADDAEHLGEGRVRGRLYDLGPFPALLNARRHSDWVSGDLYRLHGGHELLRALDRYEAGAPGGLWPRFERIACKVDLGWRGRPAWLYRYRGSVLGCARVRGGDYRVWCSGGRPTPKRLETR